jgi:hypothetical protein
MALILFTEPINGALAGLIHRGLFLRAAACVRAVACSVQCTVLMQEVKQSAIAFDSCSSGFQFYASSVRQKFRVTSEQILAKNVNEGDDYAFILRLWCRHPF